MADVGGNTVGECLKNLFQQFPDIKDMLLDKDEKLHKHIDVFVNGQSAYPEELSKQVSNGDEISILSLIIGG